MKRKYWIGVTVAAGVLLLGWLVWPTLWRYDRFTSESRRGTRMEKTEHLVRTNRLTGKTQIMSPSGEWQSPNLETRDSDSSDVARTIISKTPPHPSDFELVPPATAAGVTRKTKASEPQSRSVSLDEFVGAPADFEPVVDPAPTASEKPAAKQWTNSDAELFATEAPSGRTPRVNPLDRSAWPKTVIWRERDGGRFEIGVVGNEFKVVFPSQPGVLEQESIPADGTRWHSIRAELPSAGETLRAEFLHMGAAVLRGVTRESATSSIRQWADQNGMSNVEIAYADSAKGRTVSARGFKQAMFGGRVQKLVGFSVWHYGNESCMSIVAFGPSASFPTKPITDFIASAERLQRPAAK